MWPFNKKVELGPNLRFAKACAEAAEKLKNAAEEERGEEKELNYPGMTEEELVGRFKLALS